MHLRSLELVGWRSYDRAIVQFAVGPHLVTGANGQGKTNLLEAIHYLAMGHSHRVSDDQALVRRGATEAILRADVVYANTRRQRVEFALRPGGRNQARVDGNEQTRVSDALGYVRAVLFAPEDVMLVRGDPAHRRRFLDDLLAQRRPAYRAARKDYERVLRQRNALLKQVRAGDHGAGEALPTWTEELVRLGARIVTARLMACAALAGPVAARYADLAGAFGNPPSVRVLLERSTGQGDVAETGAEPDVQSVADELRAVLHQRAEEERERGVSLVGPHRDDLRLELNDMPAKTHASQGEAWSLALALRLASRDLLREVGEDPVMLLDDVFAELDADRRRRLAGWCEESEQVLVTAAVGGDVPLTAVRLEVAHGEVSTVADRGSGQ